jgi:hypothetical protein
MTAETGTVTRGREALFIGCFTIQLLGCNAAAPGAPGSSMPTADPSPGDRGVATSPSAATQAASAVHPLPASASAPSASAAVDEDDEHWCLTPDKRSGLGAGGTAEPPYADCDARVKVHCETARGRGLCGYRFNAVRTEAARKRTADVCCYDVRRGKR